MPSETDISDLRLFRRVTADMASRTSAWEGSVAVPGQLPVLTAPCCILAAETAAWGAAMAATGAWPAQVLFLALALWLLAREGRYRPGAPGVTLAHAASALGQALAASLLAELLLCGLARFPEAARHLVVCALAMLAGRALAWLILCQVARGRLVPRAVLIGDASAIAPALAAWRGDPAEPRLLGLIDTGGGPAPSGVPVLGGMARLEHMARAGAVDQVILAFGAGTAASEGMVRRCASLPVEIRVARAEPHGRQTRLGAWALAHALDPPVVGWSGLAKRAEDLLLGGLFLCTFALPMALLAVAIRLDSPGPALFRQRRIGFRGQVFEMLKFRTMHHEPAPAPGCVQAVRDDPRVTRLGAFLRRTSLDELPQLLNVLRGEMSLVGPRPHAPGTSADGRVFEDVVPFYAGRHRVKPGITGLAQVRGLRGETRTEADVLDRVEADYEYIQRWSIGLDLSILLRTALAVLSMRNAY